MSVKMLKATPRCARNRCRDETTWKSKPDSFKNMRLDTRTYKCTHTHSTLRTYVYTPQAHNINTHTTYIHYILGKTSAGSSLPADVRPILQHFICSISQRDSLIYRGLRWEPSIRRIEGSQNNPKKGQFLCSNAQHHSQAPEFDALGGARDFRTFIHI